MARSLRIRDTLIDDDGPAYVIAELGSNGQADTELTRRFIAAAAEAGASAVKLQKRDNATLYTRAALAAPYVHANSFGATYGEHRAALEYSTPQLIELRDYAHECGVDFGCTAFDPTSAKLLASIGVDFLKVASACITDTELLACIGSFGIPVVASTGTATMHDVFIAAAALTRAGAPFALLQCSAVYPLHDPRLLNLRVIETYRRSFPHIVTGLSSHYPYGQDALLAYMLGGRLFEKHFTLDRAMRGADHAFSLDPDGLAGLMADLTIARLMLGSPEKTRLPEEQPAIAKMGHSLYAARDLAAGETLTRRDIAIKSPGGFIPPSRLDDMLGRKLTTALAEDEPVPEMRWYEG